MNPRIRRKSISLIERAKKRLSSGSDLGKLLDGEVVLAPPEAGGETFLEEGFEQLINEGECVGTGKFGSVIKLPNEFRNQLVVVKHVDFSKEPERMLPMSKIEADILEGIKRSNHPGSQFIIKIFGSFASKLEPVYSIVMELMPYGALDDLIITLKEDSSDPRVQGLQNSKIRINALSQFTKGVACLHDLGIVHLDIKSGNILFGPGYGGYYTVKIGDFGFAKTETDLKIYNDNPDRRIVGTPYWMAPEVVGDAKYSKDSDMFAVGIVLWEATSFNQPPECTKEWMEWFRVKRPNKETFAETIPTMPAVESPQKENLGFSQIHGLFKRLTTFDLPRPSAEEAEKVFDSILYPGRTT